ncbi:diaminopropionate ammonia-lyase, partial [bacterium M00.F.Ca.ET.194.01.1.1]
SRIGDAFMTVDEEDAVLVMNRLARPSGNDPAIVSGESGGAGLAGLIRAAGDEKMRAALHLDAHSRVLIINSEGATDPGRYADLVGIAPQEVARARQLA